MSDDAFDAHIDCMGHHLKHVRRARLAPAAQDSHGDVTVKAMAMAMARVPRVEV